MAYEFLHDDGSVTADIPLNDDGTAKVVNVDQFSGQPFMENENGFICNDIMQFEQAQSDSVARAVLSRCQVLKSPSLPADMSLEQAFKQVVPANWSSPAEFVRANLQNAYNQAQEIQQKKNLSSEDKIDFTETPVPEAK